MDNNTFRNTLEKIFGLDENSLANSTTSASTNTIPADAQNVLSDKYILPSILGTGCGCASDAYTTSTNRSSYNVNPTIPRTKIGKYDIEEVIDDIYCALNIPIPGAESKCTNLNKLRKMSADRLAYFIVHESKRIVSGGGDATEELAAWLNSKSE